MAKTVSLLRRFYAAYLLVGGVLWALDVFLWLGWSLIGPEWLGPYLGVGIALAFLQSPYRAQAGALEIGLGVLAIGCWLWMAVNYSDWQLDITGYTPQKWLPGALGLVLLLEGLRKQCGAPIAILVWFLIGYAMFGHVLPGVLSAVQTTPETLVMYLYADTNGVTGFVLAIIATLALAFIVFGKLMEVSGATQFFTDIAMSMMGHRRGGPAKVAVVASAMLGSISSSPVSNIMSTGVVTIPLMKKTGFKAAHAAGIEAVASTGGQIAPPVMGATAFLMAEFLQIPYMEVVLAALLPAIFYYACLFMQIDAVARRNGLRGLPRSELPVLGPVLRKGWLFVLPLALLIYLLFWKGAAPASAALMSSASLVVFALAQRRLTRARDWAELIFGGGASIVPLLLIGGAAGVVVGLISITGLGQALTFLLAQVGTNWGLLPMLVLTGCLSILLGMGMPSTAIYVVLVSILAPAFIEMGMTAMAAHMFIFYFGVLSFLTPPVAVSSYVAAGLAESDMWRTGWIGMQLSAAAYLLPFLWAYNPALLLDGSPLEIVIVICATLSALMVLAKAVEVTRRSTRGFVSLAVLVVLIGVIGTAPVWLGADSLLALLVAAVGGLVYYYFPVPTLSPPASTSEGSAAPGTRPPG